MRSKLTKFALAATLGLALAFTFSCSIDDGGGDKGNDIANYRTVKIGDQIWMAENLNYDVSGSKCYDNKESNCDKYGRLYDWATAMALPSSCNFNSCASQISAKHRGVCPVGWHIPTSDEWDILIDLAGGNWFSGVNKLKSKSGWNDEDGNSGNGTDDYGFSALPGGAYVDSLGFGDIGDWGTWWGADDINIDENDPESSDLGLSAGSFSFFFSLGRTSAIWFLATKSPLFSVRCIKDNDNIGRSSSSLVPSSSSSSVQSGVVYGTPVTYQGETYQTVVIGTQTWFQRNLNYAVEGSKCYDNDPANCDKYGRLYDWVTAMDIDSKYNKEWWGGSDVKHKGICPSGWHLPSEAEWKTLVQFASPNKLQSSGYSNGTDDYGFAALLGGYGHGSQFSNVGSESDWWTATEYSEYNVTYAYSVSLQWTDISGRLGKGYLASVRCIKD